MTMSEIQEVINKLRALDLKTYPYDEIHGLIKQFGKFGLVEMTLHPGKILMRARPNEGAGTFTTRDELSYKPARFNKTYQRASTPNQTMFYAGAIPEDIKKGELDNSRVVASVEASSLLRDKGKEGEQLITFSKWVVTNDIPLLALCYHKDFVSKSSHTEELYNAYHKWIKELPQDLLERSILITSFLAEEFAKREIGGDFDYMISAIFSEISVSRGRAGIYYPSVKADGMAYNVAIAPEIVDSSLRLLVAGECTIYKKGDHTIVDNETICEINDDGKPFVLKPVASEHHAGRENVLRELNRR